MQLQYLTSVVSGPHISIIIAPLPEQQSETASVILVNSLLYFNGPATASVQAIAIVFSVIHILYHPISLVHVG